MKAMKNTPKSESEAVEVLEGRTITSCAFIPAEFGRTYNKYLCLTFTDGSRVLLAGQIAASPDPTPESMSKAPDFFTPEELGEWVRKDAERRERGRKEDKARRRRKYEELEKEFGGREEVSGRKP